MTRNLWKSILDNRLRAAYTALRVRLIHALGVHLLGFYKVIQKFSFTLFFCVLSSRKVRIVRNSGFYPLLVNKQILVAMFSRGCKNYDTAGYLLTGGKMLDFSGKHWGDISST